MASVNVNVRREDLKRITITGTVAKVRLPWRLLIPLKVGIALIRIGARIAGVSYVQE
jgi:hypothetical protein